MIPVTITHIGQSLDLKRKAFDHTLKLQLASGEVFSAVVDDKTVELLMRYVADDGDAPRPPAEPPAPSERSSAESEFTEALYDGEAANVFGGDPGEQASGPQQMELPVDLPAGPPVRRPVPVPQPVRIKTVPKDEYGFPVVQRTGVDAGQVLADAEVDDGVPSI